MIVAQNRVNMNNLKKYGNKMFEENADKPFTGSVFRLSKVSGTKTLEGNYKDGLMHGEWEMWYNNGNKKLFSVYKNAELIESKEWHKNEKIKQIIKKVNNQTLINSWDERERETLEQVYDDKGDLISSNEWEYSFEKKSNGDIVSEILKNGEVINQKYYHQNYDLNPGPIVGDIENLRIESEYSLIGDELDLVYESDEDGNKIYEAIIENNKLLGSNYYYSSGKKQEERGPEGRTLNAWAENGEHVVINGNGELNTYKKNKFRYEVAINGRSSVLDTVVLNRDKTTVYENGLPVKRITWMTIKKNQKYDKKTRAFSKLELNTFERLHENFDSEGEYHGEVTSRYDNGKLKYITNFKNGKKHGLYIDYVSYRGYPRKRIVSNFSNGKKVGESKLEDIE